MESPFEYNKHVQGAQFIGRSSEVAQVCNLLRNHRNVLIYGPAKIGKQSLIYNACERLWHDLKDIAICEMNLFNIRCVEAFLLRFCNELVSHFAQTPAEWSQILQRHLPHAPYIVDQSPNEPEYTYTTKAPLNDRHIEELLMLPENLAVEYGTHVIIYIRQFQDLQLFDDPHHLFLIMEKVWNRQNNTNYIITGDRLNAMEEIFLKKKYFYHFAEQIELGPIEEKAFTDYIIKGFQKAGKVILPEHASAIYNLVGGDPWYTQHLADLCFNLSKGYVNDKVIKQAISHLINLHDYEFHSIAYSLSKYQIRMIKAALDGVVKFTSADILDKYKLNTSANVSRLKEALSKKEILWFNDKQPAKFIDPLFKLWFTDYFFAE